MRKVIFTLGDQIMMASLDKAISPKEYCQLKFRNWKESKLIRWHSEKNTLLHLVKMYLLQLYARKKKLKRNADVSKSLKEITSKGIIQRDLFAIKEITLQLHHWDLFLIINNPKIGLKIRKCLSMITNLTWMKNQLLYQDKVYWVQQQITELRLLRSQVLSQY